MKSLRKWEAYTSNSLLQLLLSEFMKFFPLVLLVSWCNLEYRSLIDQSYLKYRMQNEIFARFLFQIYEFESVTN